MARPLRIQYPGAFYHVFSRGNERRDIFLSDEDRELLLACLKECIARFNVVIHSYCLMDNHIHLLLETKEPNLSKFMKYLLGVYTLRFNRIHKRAGHLFQGRYKGYLVEKDPYLLELSRYIHLNPVKAGITELPEEYPWSSMRYFLFKEAPSYLERSLILSFFISKDAYRRFVLDGLNETLNPFKNLVGGFILGSREFADQFKDKARKEQGIPGKRGLLELPTDALFDMLEFEQEDIQAYSLWKFGKKTQKEIGEFFGKTDSAISHSLKRVAKKMDKDSTLRERVKSLEVAISSFKN